MTDGGDDDAGQRFSTPIIHRSEVVFEGETLVGHTRSKKKISLGWQLLLAKYGLPNCTIIMFMVVCPCFFTARWMIYRSVSVDA